MTTLLIVIFFLALLLIGVPIFVVIAGLTIYLLFSSQIDISAIIIEMHRMATTPVLVAIPLFTFAGYLLSASGAPQRLIRLSNAILGWMPGGLSVIALVTCAVFTALTGATGLTIIALGGILLPAMMRGRYSEVFSLGLLTTSGTLGLLFPPSLPLIIYAIVAKVRIDQLFIAGLLPGLLLVVLLSAFCVYKSVRTDVPKTKFQLKELVTATREILWELPLPFVVLGGIYSGYFAVSEAAAITAVYVLFAEVVIYRDIHIRELPEIMKKSMLLVGGILLILGAAMGLTNYLVDAEIPMRLLDFVKANIESRIIFLVVLNIFLLVVGCTMGIFSALVVVVPLLAPIAKAYGIDPIHLGIIFLANLEIGASIPPLGINLFIASMRFEKPILRLYLASLPFIAILLLALAIITYVPWLSLALID
ncbi:MAG: TRAP transporter large permease subunit [Deltaproteobacteria bacterium]|jgi:tripartite ATP-independent transporter DctM subunit|nr:TRAP transporter large permease subunit [Deltaproteobacteria bacterium]MBW2584482.1 TRAP transporter large permease subunit [Deltaproteobacteria bacterium]